jgi:hypothetical protein
MKKEPNKIPLNPDTPRSKQVVLHKMPPLNVEENNTLDKKLENNENLEQSTETEL